MQELQERFLNFLEKLKNRAEEIAFEAKNIAQSAYDEDEDIYKRWYIHFQNWIRWQFDSIKQKAESVYKNEIEKYISEKSDLRIFYNSLLDFHEKIEKIFEKIFSEVKDRNPIDWYYEILEDFKKVKNSFFCKQCSAQIPLKEMYANAVYIDCDFCKTKNIFTPSSKMRELNMVYSSLSNDKIQELKEEFQKNF